MPCCLPNVLNLCEEPHVSCPLRLELVLQLPQLNLTPPQPSVYRHVPRHVQTHVQSAENMCAGTCTDTCIDMQGLGNPAWPQLALTIHAHLHAHIGDSRHACQVAAWSELWSRCIRLIRSCACARVRTRVHAVPRACVCACACVRVCTRSVPCVRVRRRGWRAAHVLTRHAVCFVVGTCRSASFDASISSSVRVCSSYGCAIPCGAAPWHARARSCAHTCAC